MNEVFFVRRHYRNVAAIYLPFFCGIMAFSVYVALAACPEDRRILALCFFSGVWGVFIALAIWILVAYWRESLTVTEGHVAQRGIISSHEMSFPEVTELLWRGTPNGGSLVLRSASRTIKVYLDNFEPEQRRWLTRLFRLSLPYSIQRDWERFCFLRALPLLKGRLDVPLSDSEVLITRHRWDSYFLPATLLSAMIGVLCAWHLGQPQCLLFPVPVVGVWLWMRFTTPRKGFRSQRLSKMFERGFLLSLLVWTGIATAALAVDRFVSPHLSHPSIWPVSVCVLWFIAMGVVFYRLDHWKQQREQPMAFAAAEEWEKLEGRQAEEMGISTALEKTGED